MRSVDGQDPDIILLTREDTDRIRKPWSYSVIIKLTKTKISHEYFKQRLKQPWKPSEELILIDLGNNYFIVNS